MTNKTTNIDAIISAIEDEAKQFVSDTGTPKITKNTADVSLRNFTYQTPSPSGTLVSINHLEYENDTDLNTQAKFPVQTRKTISTFTFSFTEGFKFGTKSTLKVGIPDIGEASGEISFELDFSATQTLTKTNEQSWTYDESVPVPKRSKVCADLVINKNEYDPKFSGEVVLTGEIVAFASASTKTKTSQSEKRKSVAVHVPAWLYNRKDEYPAIKFEGFQDFKGKRLPTKAIISVEGKFTGVSGSNMQIKAKQVEIGEDCTTTVPKVDIYLDCIEDKDKGR